MPPEKEVEALCDHGCQREGTVQHADGRLLCRACYEAEVGVSAGNPPCPTCHPEPTLLYESQEAAEQAIRVFIEVMPSLIVECAKDIHERWLDGREKPNEADTMARVERIVREKFRA